MNTSFEVNQDATTTTWLTPPEIIKALGKFDLDPCSPINRPWDTATHHYTEVEDGLNQDWFGRVWLNPPYGTKIMPLFLERMAKHGNGIALVYNRAETEQFFEHVWNIADAILFKKGRIRFYKINGQLGGSPGCGSVFIAYGDQNVSALRSSGIEGKLILLK
jgi:hypothetical protein